MTDKKPDNFLWIEAGNNVYYAAPRTEPFLPPGCYTVNSSTDGRNFFTKQEVATDDLIVIEDSHSEKIVKEIEDFWNLKDRFDQYGFVHKRGILLAGPPGGGKTVTLNLVVQAVINKWNGIAVYLHRPGTGAVCLRDFRTVEPERPVVVIIEDIDEMIANFGESTLLDLLDGGQQIKNVVFIATTNHIEKLEDRIVKRPSRFDTVVFIYPPEDNLRREFFKKKVPGINNDDLEQWVKLSAGLSFAHLKEMVIMCKCFGRDIEEVVKKLRSSDILQDSKNFIDDQKNPVGFQAPSENTLPSESVTKRKPLKEEFNK